MRASGLDIVFLGLAISSSWGNGHATTYRGLVRALARAGHRVTFLERDVPWYRQHRDCAAPEGCALHLYTSLAELEKRHARRVREADAVIVGSYVPEGVAVGNWVVQTARGVTAFYDIDTPVTLAKLERGDQEYLSGELVRAYDIYFSFTGGPTLQRLERELGAHRARPLYCSVDPDMYAVADEKPRWEVGYLGTYSADRQPALERLLCDVARRSPEGRFVVGGPCYPESLVWPVNVEHTEHVAPHEHPRFYARQRFTLNVTRADMIRAGWSPSVRLFEAAACGVPIISDVWPGLETLLSPGSEILLAKSTDDVRGYLADVSDDERRAIGRRARERVLSEHTARHRAVELTSAIEDVVYDVALPRAAAGSGR
jgi:spore maturation protein CgeB